MALHIVLVKRNSNGFDLYDMVKSILGKVMDWYGAYEDSEIVQDPYGPATGTQRVLRGGSWWHYSGDSRVSERNVRSPVDRSYNIGFRLAHTL